MTCFYLRGALYRVRRISTFAFLFTFQRCELPDARYVWQQNDEMWTRHKTLQLSLSVIIRIARGRGCYVGRIPGDFHFQLHHLFKTFFLFLFTLPVSEHIRKQIESGHKRMITVFTGRRKKYFLPLFMFTFICSVESRTYLNRDNF